MKNISDQIETKNIGLQKKRIRYSKCPIHGKLYKNTVIELFTTKTGKKYHKCAICYKEIQGKEVKRTSKKNILIQKINLFEEKKEKFDLFFQVSNKIKTFNQVMEN